MLCSKEVLPHREIVSQVRIIQCSIVTDSPIYQGTGDISPLILVPALPSHEGISPTGKHDAWNECNRTS